MRNRSAFLIMATLLIGGPGCGVAGIATDAVLADALAEAVTDAVTDVLLTEITVPAAQLPDDDAASEIRDIVDDVVDTIVADVVVTRDVPKDAVTVTLVNDSPSFAVEVTVAYDDHVLPLVWFGLGSEETFVLEPGETVSFWKDCDDLRTVVIDDADLLVPGGRNRETESGLLNEGIDYECDDEIRFVFDHSDETRDFDVSVAILSPNRPPRPTLQDSILDLFHE